MELGLEAGLEPASGEPYRRFTDETMANNRRIRHLMTLNYSRESINQQFNI